MHYFRYVGNKLYCEGVPVESLVRKYGTPLYVYSQRTLTEHFEKLDRALAPLDHLICFAMKSNSNLSVLRTLATLVRPRLFQFFTDGAVAHYALSRRGWSQLRATPALARITATAS